jgi:hypothetical protein
MRYDCYEMARPRRYETNAEKQKAYRKRKKGGDVKCKFQTEEVDSILSQRTCSEAAPTVQSSGAAFETKKVGEFRMLVLPETVEEEPVKPQIFRNDNGAVISEWAWKMLQEKKRRAKEGGYEIDDYSQ